MHQGFQVFGVLFQFAANENIFARFLEGFFKEVVADRLGDEVGGVVLQAFDGEVHVAVAGDHDDLGFGVALLEAAQQGDAVQAGHLDVGEHDVRLLVVKNAQGLLAVFGGQNGVAAVGQRNTEDLADPFLVIYQKQFGFHGN
jgi:hypothetical protein